MLYSEGFYNGQRFAEDDFEFIISREEKVAASPRKGYALDKAIIYVMWLLSSIFAILLISVAAYFVQNFIDSTKMRRMEEIPFGALVEHNITGNLNGRR